ncbi:TIGR02281 family clan AA aspartic protease [Pelagibius sp.]|uniref:retropepsin-like aspartic protease family protein n=1 Tax=Pelagibius sp. TaxID=1931238 RepID=UPI002605A8E6|nr:TIGR02281 family clan AA aspartic protease [Pelagibius sp.]
MADYRDEGGAVVSTGLLGHTLRLAAAVVVIGFVVVLLIDRNDGMADLGDPEEPAAQVSAVPGAGAQAGSQGGSEIVLKAGAHGHFMVDATVDGEVIRFLVDTGASSIFLTPQDAETLGWSKERLTFSQRYETANGEIRAAPVELRSVRIGQLEFYDLPASVGEAPGSISLLGMSFLKRFESYEFRGDTMILTW